MAYDWSKFTVKINIKASTKAVYEAWVIPALLEEWFLRQALFRTPYDTVRERTSQIQAGDAYEWLWHGYTDESVEKRKVIEADGHTKIQFEFSGNTLVTVDIGTVLDETIVMLTQENIPDTEEGRVNYHIGCMNGWTFYLTNLKSYLEGGIDLRNRNTAFTGVINS